MARNCLRSSVIYQATETTEDSKPDKTYVGLTETSFKTRFANHKSSFNDPSKIKSTEPSKHVWHLKEENLKFGITWKVLKQTTPFSPVLNRYNLCQHFFSKGRANSSCIDRVPSFDAGEPKNSAQYKLGVADQSRNQ